MRIGIDVSQLAYPNTGVANYLENLVSEMIKDEKKVFVLFFSSFRRNVPASVLGFAKNKNVSLVVKKFPPTVLHILWNRLHILPIESFIGSVDLFITSDWTEPPSKNAKKATIIYDLVIYRHPEETDKKIVRIQKDKLDWVRRESDLIFCISESTKNDVSKILRIENEKLKVIYPGVSL